MMNHLLFQYLTKTFPRDLFVNGKCKGVSDVEELKDPEKVALLKKNRSKIIFFDSDREISIDFDIKDEKIFFKYKYICKGFVYENIFYGLIYLYSDHIGLDVYVLLDQFKYKNSPSKSAYLFKEFISEKDYGIFEIDEKNLDISSFSVLDLNKDEVLDCCENAFLNEFNLNLFKVTHFTNK